MKLATKIALGFGTLIAIAVVLGSLAVWKMNEVKEAHLTKLAQEFVPEVVAANNIERSSLETMYDMRGYGLTGEQHYLDGGLQGLESVKKNLVVGHELANRSKFLVKLKSALKTIDTKVAQYEQLVQETVATTKDLVLQQGRLNEAATHYMKNCADFLAGQKQTMQKEIAEGAEPEQLKERLEKISLVGAITNIGYETRIACFKSQAERNPALIQDAQKNFETMAEEFAALRTITHLKVDIDRIGQTETAAKTYKEGMNRLLEDWLRLQELGEQRGTVGENVLALVQETAQVGLKHTDDVAHKATASLKSASDVMIGGLVVAALIGLILAIVITRSITKPFQQIFKGLKTFSRKELEQTGSAFKRIIQGMNDSISQVNDAASQVSAASQQSAEGVSEQASSLEETSSALEEMAAMTRTNAANSKEADNIASKAHKAANDGEKTMTAINESSDQINKIIKVIEEIAFQTNLLALNAAVEAARAGEHGKGFAVVADEVRNLAQRAANAAGEITTLIENSVEKSQEGVAAIRTIVGGISKVAELIRGIAQASDEQAQGVDQVNTAVSQMDKVTQQNAAGAEESASAAEELAAQAEATRGMVEQLVVLIEGDDGRGNAAGAVATRTQPHATHVSADVAHFNQGQTGAYVSAQSKNKSTTQSHSSNDFLSLDDAGLDEF